MKTERVTLLTSPEFKAFLGAEAAREHVSVAELVRSRCQQRPSEDDAVLVALTAELRAAVVQAKKALREGLAEAEAVLGELRARRAPVVEVSSTAKPAVKTARRERSKVAA
jgi:hypothetical protein